MSNTAENFDQQQIISFLKENPDWLEQQPDLLEKLTAQTEGGTISLAERQLKNLRSENKQLKNDIQLYLANARENEHLLNTTFDFCLTLLLCEDAEQLTSYMKTQCHALFQLPQMRLYLNDGDSWQTTLSELKTALTDNMPVSDIVTGRLVASAKTFLFDDPDQVASVALIPIGDQCANGLLVLASEDEQHFDPHKGDLFLQLIAKSLLSWCQQRGA